MSKGRRNPPLPNLEMRLRPNHLRVRVMMKTESQPRPRKMVARKNKARGLMGVSVSPNTMTRIGCQNYNALQGVI